MNKQGSIFIGWDIGGAHLKLAVLDSNANTNNVQQFSTPIWKGLSYLEEQIDWVLINILHEYQTVEQIHAITMTAELCDYFDNREDGVKKIVQLMMDKLSNRSIFFYAANKGFVQQDNVDDVLNSLASSNWHATASFIATNFPAGLLVDMGSTTTDIIAFKNKQLLNNGYSDHDRLYNNELIYTGIVRTPVMALSEHVVYNNKKYNLMAEYFATTADIYRVLEQLNEHSDQADTPDGRGKTKQDSLLRLRRMIGLDAASSYKDEVNTIEMASYLSNIQAKKITDSVNEIIIKHLLGQDLFIVRAGCGVDILSNMLASLNYEQKTFDSIVKNNNIESYTVNTCASAISVAELLRIEYAY